MKHLESKLQTACVKWFRIQYPAYARNLFAIPNGGARDVVTGAILKREGVLPGVADLFLAIPRYTINKEEFCAGLFIEMKFGAGTQSKEQKEFQTAVEREEYKYIVVRTLDEFIDTIKAYMR
jgi:hypothetical protein